jgi:hypothetical protein
VTTCWSTLPFCSCLKCGGGVWLSRTKFRVWKSNLPPYSKKSYETEPVKMLYQPLNVDEEIRLISLAGENSAEVSIPIEHVSLINPPSYTALSYCWGDQSETQTISIDGRKFQVTSNHEAALRLLRTDGCVRL